MIFISFIQHIHTFYRHTALFLTNITMSMCYSDNQSNDRFEDILCLDLWATHTYGTYLIIFNSTADTPALQFWPSLNYVIEKHKDMDSHLQYLHAPTYSWVGPAWTPHRLLHRSPVITNKPQCIYHREGFQGFQSIPHLTLCTTLSVSLVSLVWVWPGVTKCHHPLPTGGRVGVCVCTLPAATHWHGLAHTGRCLYTTTFIRGAVTHRITLPPTSHH